MLRHLTIKNYALIRHLQLGPSPHLNVITGETGAGKSILLGAIGLLMGNRADTKVLWNEDEKCIVEGEFQIAEEDFKETFLAHDLDFDQHTALRREISPGGKSRAFINDTPVTLDVMRTIGSRLMDVHSQHETLQLGNQSFQRNLVDGFAQNQSIRQTYDVAWKKFREASQAYEELERKAATLKDEADFIQFQLKEFRDANITAEEFAQLESEVMVLEHAEEIKSKLRQAINALSDAEYAALNGLSESKTQLAAISNYSPLYANLLERMETLFIELNELVRDLEHEEGHTELDEQRYTYVQDRLAIIYRLMQKHRTDSIDVLIGIQANLEEKNNLSSNVDEHLRDAKRELENAHKELLQCAEALSVSRKQVALPLSDQVSGLLKKLGIPNAVFRIDSTTVEPAAHGADKIEILFSANKGVEPRPIALVASGGEFSRLMFSIKYVMAERSAMPTLVLDEIDAGISGEIAIQLGQLMKEMSRKHQLIAISHLPQIAAKGDMHFYVYKDHEAQKTVSHIKPLAKEERVAEIAKMIGGATPSKLAIENAQELLA